MDPDRREVNAEYAIMLYEIISLKDIYCKIRINHQPDATIFQFIILTFIYSSTCFGRFPAHHQEPNDRSGSLWFYLCTMMHGLNKP
jgi:hypothetical protein